MRVTAKSDLFRLLPSVDELLRYPQIEALAQLEGRSGTLEAARTSLEQLRTDIAAGKLDEQQLKAAIEKFPHEIERRLKDWHAYSLRRVINATGVILHTNLGRAPLSHAALQYINEISQGYSNLEFDLRTGERGKRDVHVVRLIVQLLNAAEREISTIVVNNNAAAVLLALNSLAEGGEVLVSRGELVEIGGSFRIPDVMAKSGAILCEVGTTNRTRTADYERAITERTRLLLRVHRSNFEITGFTEQASTAELVALARKHNIPLMEDLGSGALFDLRAIGISGEPGVLDSLRSGVDVVTYSGDKLLGGPQAGLISGSSELIARMRSNSLFRALRVDKLTYAALEATLLAYVRRDHDAIPTLRMMRLSKEAIGKRAEALAAQVAAPKLKVEVVDGESILGGGAAPSSVLPTPLLALTCEDLSADELAARLRGSDP